MRKQGLYNTFEGGMPRKGKYPRTEEFLVFCGVLLFAVIRNSAIRLGRYGDDHGIQINMDIALSEASGLGFQMVLSQSLLITNTEFNTCSWTLGKLQA
jgi:hypothetical protein